MATAADVRRLAEKIADTSDDAARLLGERHERHPVAEALMRALKDVARTLEAARA
jgi:hypothetical protein